MQPSSNFSFEPETTSHFQGMLSFSLSNEDNMSLRAAIRSSLRGRELRLVGTTLYHGALQPHELDEIVKMVVDTVIQDRSGATLSKIRAWSFGMRELWLPDENLLEIAESKLSRLHQLN